MIQSRSNSDGARIINDHAGPYHVWTRGKQHGEVVDRFDSVNSINHAVIAEHAWPELLTLANDPELRLIVSNTTEQGLQLDPADSADIDVVKEQKCPASYPAKLAALLYHRFQAGLAGLTILPLELVEYNASKLLSLVKQQSAKWTATSDDGFLGWLESDNRWLNNLVDRIVVSVSDDPPWPGADPLAVVAEPYRLLAIEDDGGNRQILPDHDMIEWVDDLSRVFLRKVRILNGLHTAMVAHSLPQGFETVLDAISDETERAWLESMLHEEILPALQSRGVREEAFARDVMERFENSFFRHKLTDIANGHAKKLTTRIQPTIDDFRKAFGKDPEKLLDVLNGDVT